MKDGCASAKASKPWSQMTKAEWKKATREAIERAARCKCEGCAACPGGCKRKSAGQPRCAECAKAHATIGPR